MFGFFNAKPRRLDEDAPSRVFISYSRKDMEAADRIAAALEDRGIDVLIDRRNLPLAGKWQEEIKAMILASDAIVWLASKHSITSKWCTWELEIRRDENQMLVPLMVDSTRPEDLPDELGKWQCLSFFEPDDVDLEMEKLIEAVRAPYAWVKEQRWLADQAKRKDGRLRGKTLADAVTWLDGPPDTTWLRANPGFAPKPTPAIRDLISKSRKLAKRDRIAAIAASILGSFAVAGVAWYSIGQQQIAESRQLARSSSQATEQGDAGAGLLMALKGLPGEDTVWKRPVVSDSHRAAYQALFAVREDRVLVGHRGALTHAELSKDGRLVLTSSVDGTARLWHMNSGIKDGGHDLELDHGETSSSAAVNMARLSPDGSRIVTVSDDHSGILWDIQGNEIARLDGHTRPVLFAGFSRDGRLIVTAGEDYTARLWSAADGRHVKDFKGHGHVVIAADFSPDGRLLATASSDGTARIWTVDEEAEPVVLDGHGDRVLSVTFDETGSFLASTPRDRSAILWTSEGELIRRLDGHEGVVNRVRVATGGKFAVTASDDNTAKLWDLSNGNEITTLTGHDSRVIDAQFSADGTKILTASVDGAIGLWRRSEGDDGHRVERFALLRGHERDIVTAQFSADGQWVISASKDHTARLWRANEDGDAYGTLRNPCDIRSFAFSDDGAMVMTVCKGGLVRIWDAKARVVINERNLEPRQIISAAFSPTGALIALAHEDGSASLYRLHGETLAKVGGDFLGHEARVRSVEFSSDGKTLVTSSADHTARIWDVQTRDVLLTIDGHDDRVRSARFSPGDDLVMTVSADGTAKIWDSQTGSLIRTIDSHDDDVWAADFSPDGSRIVTGSQDGQLFITEVAATGASLRLVGHGDNIRSAEFSRDSRHVVTSSWDRTVRLWDAATGDQLAVIRNSDIVLGAAFDPSGKRIGHLVKNRVMFRPVYPTVEDLVAAAKEEAPKRRTAEGLRTDGPEETKAGLFARMRVVISDAVSPR